MSHPITSMIKQAARMGNTAIDKKIGVRLKRLNKFKYSADSLDLLYRNRELFRLGPYVTLPSLARSEALIARWLACQGNATKRTRRSIGPLTGPLSPSQAKAAAGLLACGSGLLLGAPGTGKTWLIARLIRRWIDSGLRVKVCAPTGKAAVVLGEKVSCNVTTIHSLLDMRPGGSPKEYIYADIVVVDESSMIDSEMMGWLLQAAGKANVILVGDPYQLPPVGAGCPFHDMIKANVLPTFTLTEVQRQAENSGIVKLAHQMISGSRLEFNDDVSFIRPPRLNHLEDWVVDWWFAQWGNGDIGKVIAPLRKAKFDGSILNINRKISSKRYGSGSDFSIGDSVIFKQSSKKLGIVNGREGEVVSLNDISIVISSATGSFTLSRSCAEEWIEKSYAITVHKAQGSEWDEVLLVMPSNAAFMLRARLVYTAATRAKSKLHVVGDPNILLKNRDWSMNRVTILEHFLRTPEDVSRVLIDDTYHKAWESLK